MTISSPNSQDLMNKDEALSLIHEIKNDVNSIRQKLLVLKNREGWKGPRNRNDSRSEEKYKYQ